jgi:DNA ligase (NAD+)
MNTMTATATENIEELIAQRNEASAAYYEGNPIMSDDDFDVLDARLTQLGVDSEVGHGYVPTKNTIRHQYPLLSLTKVRTVADVDKWASKYSKTAGYVIQPKYDGLALDITYSPEGNFLQAATRGDGEVGEDVTHTVQSMINAGKIPATVRAFSGNTHVLGEVYMTTDDLIVLNASQTDRVYANPRNAAAGLLRRKSVDLSAYLSFVAYDTNNYEADEIAVLAEQGFVTPKDHFFTVAQSVSEVDEAIKELGVLKTQFNFDTDGVVIKLAATRAKRENIGNSSSAPRWAVAYKFANVIKTTVIREVIWNVTRTGRLVPVAIFDETLLAGAKVTQATLHNHAQFVAHDLHVGDTIEVTRSNEVIPFVVGKVGVSAPDAVKFEAPKEHGGHPVRLNATGKDLLIAAEAVADVNAAIVYSLKALNADGISTSMVGKLLAAGKISNFLDLLNVTREDILELDGTGAKSADNFANTIAGLYTQPLWRWIAAMGLRFIANNKSPILEARYSTLDELAKATESELLNLEGFGGEKSKSILESSATIQHWADRLRSEHNFVPSPAKAEAVVESKGDIDFNGKKVVVTGSFTGMKRPEIEAWLKAHGAKVSSSVSSTTDLLVAGEKAGSKLAKAEELGIQVMTGPEFEAQI